MTTPDQIWADFISTVYSPPNDLSIGSTPVLDKWLAVAQQAFVAVPQRPFILPVKVGNTSEYYAVAPDLDQARLLRRLLTAAIGSPWSTFDGANLAETRADRPLDQSVLTMANNNDPRLAYRFAVPTESRSSARASLMRLMENLADLPIRSSTFTLPIGRLIGDFEEACAGQRRRAAELAWQALAQDHRINARNQLFLEVRFCTAFEDWARLEELVSTSEVLRLRRPALVSDALARLALVDMSSPLQFDAFSEVATRFGALITSTSEIRSQVGADYYGLWAITCGENSEEVAERIRQSGWSPEALSGLGSWGKEQQILQELPSDPRSAIRFALEQGRHDAALSLLAVEEPNVEYWETVLRLVVQHPTQSAIELLDRYCAELGVTDLVLGHEGTEAPLKTDLGDAFRQLADASTEPATLTRLGDWIQSHGPADAARPQALLEASQVLHDLVESTSGGQLGRLVDAALNLATSLRLARYEGDGIAEFGLATLEAWAFSDVSGDRHRLRRSIDLTEDVLARGVTPAQFREVVECLRACWDPFLTDADCGTGIETIELLLQYSPEGADVIGAFALPILSRIGQHNVNRIDSTDIRVAELLATEFGVILDVRRSDGPDGPATPVDSHTVLIYSLFTGAAARASQLLVSRHPGLTVETNHDHVATERLKAQVDRSDLIVITDRAAKHAATNAIRSRLGNRTLGFAAGRGSSSIIDAVEDILSAPEASAA